MSAHSLDESSLCQTCGLCCQGLLYSFVALRADEVGAAKTWPVEMVTRDDEIGFKQPCGCLTELRCSVYARRPQTCAQYRCQLLRRLRQKEISPASAFECVAEARRLIAEIETHIPAVSCKSIWQRINERWNLFEFQHLLAKGELNSEALTAIVGLDIVLTKYFRVDKKG